MSSRERWDVVLYFAEGPMSLRGDIVCRGPVVRMGANPGPGGLKIEGYRGLDDRQAVISAYDGATVSIAPVGSNQVRVSPHPHVDWREIQPIRGPQYLTPESAFHLGPPGRGCTVWFVEARKLGDWEQARVLSDAADVNPDVQPSEVRELKSSKWPVWFVPSLVVMAMLISVALVAPWFGQLIAPPKLLGPVDEGVEYIQEPLDLALGTQVDLELYQGFEQPWVEFVVIPNMEVSGDTDLQDPENFDQRLLKFSAGYAKQIASGQSFWKRLDDIRYDYAEVVKMLRDEKMPEAFAGVPYVESVYRPDPVSPVCAAGWWQFMPEVGNRLDLRIEQCTLRGSAERWQPTAIVPPKGILKTARYINRSDANCGLGGTGRPDRNCCLISACEVDEREDLAKSTRAAIGLFSEAWNAPLARDSGAAVQIAIAAHNAGWDNEAIDGNRKPRNLRPAYERWLDRQGLDRDPSFVGEQIRCEGNDFRDSDSCGAVLHQHTQHYTYKALAIHFLAVCYYATNYPDDPVFADWKGFTGREGYCRQIDVPTREKVQSW
ncbi:MAG: hypothetical protein VX899_11570 [Myxococcota bacterium]|nr:hypothetical protein [Myxococcota bacterium]